MFIFQVRKGTVPFSIKNPADGRVFGMDDHLNVPPTVVQMVDQFFQLSSQADEMPQVVTSA